MEPARGRGDLIDGAFVGGSLSNGDTLLESKDPARAFAVSYVVTSRAANVHDAVCSAKKAQRAWFACGLETRRAYLERLKGVFKAKADALAEVIVRETGKPHREALAEARSLGARIDLILDDGLARIATLRPPGTDGEARAHPQGVVAVLGPYNYPAHLLNAHVIPALVTGNTIVMKPSEHTPWSGEVYASCFLEAGLPPGVVNMVQGKGDVGRALVAHEGVDAVLFTGSYATGRAILEATLDQPNKLVALEMGGKNIAVVLDDADPLQALSAVLQGAFLTTGQRCTATARVLVHQRIFDRFTDALVAAARELKPGDPWREDTPFGPLANKPGLERFLRLKQHGEQSGVEALLPGRLTESGGFVTPSIHLLPPGRPDPKGYLDEELFGPDLCVERIEDDDHAIRRMNESPFGLSNAVFTTRPERFERFYRETKSGLLNHNRSTNGASGKLPFGGVGRSGNQRAAGVDAVRYTTFPVALLRAEAGDAPVEDAFRDAVGKGRALLGVGAERLVVRHGIEAMLERYRIAVDDVRAADVLVPLHVFRALRLEEQTLDAAKVVDRLSPWARVEPPHLVITAPDEEDAPELLARLARFLDQLARENPIHTWGYAPPGINLPSGGALPRSEALLRRLYQADFVPREKKPAVVDLGMSEGAYLRSVDDDPLVLVDASSQIGSLGLGFQSGPFLRALDEGDLGPWLLSNPDVTAPFVEVNELKELTRFLCDLAWPGIQHASFTSGGSEANERAFDLCRMHGPGGRRIIAFEGSFHGRTYASLHATWNPAKRRPFELPGYEASFVPFPAWADPREEPPYDDAWIQAWSRGELPDESHDPVVKAEVHSLVRVREEIERGDVCAVIVEPMQGEGGDNYATARFFQGLRALTRHLGVPLIFDEVQTGFGLSGMFYWHTRFKLRDASGRPDGPDCVTLAKKAQLGVCLSVWPDPRPAAAHVAQAVRGLLHGQAIIELSPFETEALVRDSLWNLAVDYPLLVLNPRNQGWCFSFDLPTAHLAQQFIHQRFYRGFMAYIAGDNTVRFRLNASWTDREVKTLFAGLRAALDAIADTARDAEPDEQLEAMSKYVAPAWEEGSRKGGRRDETKRRFPGEYDRLSADPPALLRWLLALPRGPLERVCDRVLALEAQCPEETLDQALKVLTRARTRPPGTGIILDRLRQLSDEIDRTPNPKAAYKKHEQRLAIGPARLVIESIGARLHRLSPDEWDKVKHEVLKIERSTYEEGRQDSEEELRRMVQSEGGMALVLRRRTDHGDRILGYAFGGPVESYHADGPREDPLRGLGNTFYSANITVAANERGAGLGLRLKRAQVRLVSSITGDNGQPKYHYMTGRNRVGATRQMTGINRAFGAYPVEHFRGNQYGDRSGEALYYRVPLRRPHITTGLPTKKADTVVDWASGVQAPLGQHPDRLARALESGELTFAVGTKLTLSNFVTPDYVRYAELLRALAPRGLGHSYFTSGRAEVVDKGVRCLKVRRPQGDVVIGLEKQFLGTSTAAARSLTDPAGHAQPFAWYDWPKVPHPAEAGPEASLGAIMAAVNKVGPERVLGVVVELAGEKSGLVLPSGFFEDLCTLRRDTGIPVVAVETASALGRLGTHLWASDAFAARPSMVWWYAGAQLGHIFCDDQSWVATPLTLISTWDGDEISIVRTRHHLLEAREALRARRAHAFEDALLDAVHGKAIALGKGLLFALDVETEARAEKLLEHARAHGLHLTRGLPGRVMVVPPVNVGDSEIFEGMRRLKRALEAL